MKTTIRNRAAAAGIAAVAGFAGVGLASGTALAASPPATANSAATTAANQPQSVHYPTDPGLYADEFVRAWGAGNISRVEAFAAPSVVGDLSNHGNENAAHWVQTGSEGAAGTIYVDYENTVTGEKMAVGVANEAVSNGGEWGEPNGIHSVQFAD